MSFLSKLLESIFPFLFSALKRSWDNLTQSQQTALTNAGVIGQFLKNNLTALGGDLVQAISNQTGLSEVIVQQTMLALANEFGLQTTDVNAAILHLQSKLTAAQSTSEWNGLLSTILNAGATILSGGAIDWVHVALGLGEWVYQQLIKGTPIAAVTPAIPFSPITPAAFDGQPPHPSEIPLPTPAANVVNEVASVATAFAQPQNFGAPSGPETGYITPDADQQS
jgi:hypothetical protein